MIAIGALAGHTPGHSGGTAPDGGHEQWGRDMGIGAGIFLIAVGAVLAFAVNATVAGLNIVTIGVILMIVGALGIALDLALFMPRRRRVTYAATEAPVARTTTTDVY